jgi:signal transduction histidine kinase
MKKLYFILYLGFCTFITIANNCNDKMLYDELPLEIKTALEDANTKSRESTEVAQQMLENLRQSVQHNQNYSTEQKYNFLQNIEKTAGIIYEENNELEKAKNCYLKELSYIELTGNKENKMGAFIDLAIVEKRKGNFNEAKENYTKCLELAETENNNKLQDFAQYGLGTLYEASGEYEKAVQCYLKSLKLAEERGSRSDAINTMQNLAITYTKLNNNQLALETIEKAYAETKSMKDSTLVASITFDYGKVLAKIGNTDAALEKFQQSLEIFKLLNFKPLIARSLFYMADIYTQKSDFEKAKTTFLECKKYENFISKRSFVELHIKLGDLYLRESDIQKSKKAYLDSYEVADKCNYKELKKESSAKLSNVFNTLGDYKSAFFYMNIASNIKDSIYNETQGKAIAELQLKYNSEKTAHEIETLKFGQRQMWFLFGGIIALICIASALYFVRLTRKNNKELMFKNSQIKEQNKILTEQNTALEQFAYAAAHDLKEPLRNIGSFINLLQRRYQNQFDENALEYMGFITSGVKRMNDLLTGLLNLSSLTTQRAENEDVNLSEIVEVVKSNLKVAIEEKDAVINYKGKAEHIPMNQLHMIQLMQNLVGNALKFVEKRPSIEIDTEETDDNFQITIKDNGIGMDKLYEAKVFRLFQRLDKTKNYEGNGVGLSICKNIVEKYGGKIWYESELNHGTQFFIHIPKSPVLKAA